MKFEIKQKITFYDDKGAYALFRKGEYETEDELEIKLLKRSKYAVQKRNKAKPKS